MYMPPPHADEIQVIMSNLVEYINNDEMCDADPLVKRAIIHQQLQRVRGTGDWESHQCRGVKL